MILASRSKPTFQVGLVSDTNKYNNTLLLCILILTIIVISLTTLFVIIHFGDYYINIELSLQILFSEPTLNT